MSDDEIDPDQQKWAALEEFKDACDRAEDAGVVEGNKIEADAFDKLADELAECVVADPDMMVTPLVTSIKDISSTINVTDARQEITSRAQEKSADGTGRERLNEWIRENIQEVQVIRSTDHVDNTKYRWDFDVATVETSGGPDGRGHYDWVNFRDTIDEAGGPYLREPDQGLTDTVEWRSWIVEIRQQNETKRTTVGPRTNAVQAIQDKIHRSEGFGDLLSALNWQGVYVDTVDDPPDDADPIEDPDAPKQRLPEWRVGAVYIDNEWAKEAAEDFGVTTRALQNELDARGHMIEGHSKVATREYVDGQYITFWALDGSIATPRSFTPEGVDVPEGGLDALDTDDETDDDFGGVTHD